MRRSSARLIGVHQAGQVVVAVGALAEHFEGQVDLGVAAIQQVRHATACSEQAHPVGDGECLRPHALGRCPPVTSRSAASLGGTPSPSASEFASVLRGCLKPAWTSVVNASQLARGDQRARVVGERLEQQDGRVDLRPRVERLRRYATHERTVAWAWIATASALISPGCAAMRSATSAWTMTTSRAANGGPAAEQVAQRGRGDVVRQVGHHDERRRRNSWPGRRCSTSPVTTVTLASRQLAAQRIGQLRVDLDRHDAPRHCGQPLGQHAQPGPDLQDVGRRRPGRAARDDRRGHAAVVEERLRQPLARAQPEGARVAP